MSRFRVSILIIGMLVIVVAASLLTVFALYITGAVVTERTELVFAVSDEEKIYDGTPLNAVHYELVSGEMRKGHYAEVEFSGSQTDAGESRSSLSIKICDPKGFDVTSEYKIGVSGGLLKVLPKDISVTLNDEEVTYNGTKVNFENYTVTEGELVLGHKIAGSQNVQLITVKDALPSDLKPVVFDAVGKDVTKNYNVNFTIGEIRVVPRPVTVKPADKVKVYDGVEINLNEVEILSGSLADGQYFKEIEINSGDTRFIDVTDSGVTHITKIKIYQRIGSEEIEVTENYDLDYFSETGVVRIEKRPLTITAKSRSWEYDGTEHDLSNDTEPLSCEGLAPGEQLISIKYSGSRKNAGETENNINIKDIRILDKATSQSASLDNYEITVISGTLTVLKREVTIITPTLSKAYDGEPLMGASENEKPIGLNLATNHKIDFDEDSLLSITEHGTIRNRIECKIVDEFDVNNTDLSDNYNITYYYGEITVVKRTVRVTTPSYTKVFDGDTLYCYEEIEDIDVDNLVTGHSIVAPAVDEVYGITDVTRILNKFKVSVQDNTGVDVSDNYDIVYTYGALEITRLYISVRTGSETREYNNKPLQCGDDKTDFGFIPEGLEPVVDGEYPSITDVSKRENRFSYKLLKDGKDVDKNNYRFEYTYGYLEIIPCNVYVDLENYDFDYKGEAWIPPAPEEAIISLNGADGSYITHLDKNLFTIATGSAVKDVGDYTYTVKFIDSTNDRNHNLYAYGGKITISKCPIDITLPTEEKSYNGKSQLPTSDVMEGDLPNGLEKSDFKIVSESGNMVNASDYPYYYTAQMIDSREAENYEITVTGGILKINRCDVTVTLKNFIYERYYNGSEHKLSLAEAVESVNCGDADTQPITMENLAFYFELTTSVIIKDAGNYTYKIRFIYNDNYSNFNLKITNRNEEGTYVVNKFEAQLTGRILNLSKVYDGKGYTHNYNSDTGNRQIRILDMSGYEIPFISSFSVTYETDKSSAATHALNYTNLRIINDDGDDITRNINIIEDNTMVNVTIKPRDITFTLQNYICSSVNGLRSGSPEFAECLKVSSSTPLLSGYYISFNTDNINFNRVNNNYVIRFNDFASIVIHNENGEDVTDNFNITNISDGDDLTAQVLVIGQN